MADDNAAEQAHKAKKLERQKKYKKPHKEHYLKIQQMHLQGKDYMGDLEGMVKEQEEFTKKKQSAKFKSPIPRERQQVYDYVAQRMSEKKRKGYVRLVTNKGNINMELCCHLAPKSCDNFLSLCEARRYNGSAFYRIIKGFMMQGGRQQQHGDACIWGNYFEDEHHQEMRHDRRGVVSFANAGMNKNGSELYVEYYCDMSSFITFVASPHLDDKMNAFGKVVGGFVTLDAIEQIALNEEKEPTEQVTIVGTVVYWNPFKRALQKIKATET